MSSIIIENLIRKKNKVDFDFSKSIKENQHIVSYDFENEMPIEVKDSSWDYINVNNIEMLIKTYNFETFNHMMFFLNECMKKFNNLNVFPAIKIKNNNVNISLYTEGINSVGELDLELSKYLDELNDDITFIKGL
jgi:pterin-4a-carbinolamine dehydratase